MRIGIVDADLISRRNHRFPNLACEKISGYWKEQGAEVELIMSFDVIGSLFDTYDLIYISKVFTDTPVPYWLMDSERIHLGGTGFYFDKAENLPDEIEHHMPDYHLYDDWMAHEIEKAEKVAIANGKEFNRGKFMVQFKEYTDYSIGFLTRGCFRKCKFCVNQKYDHVFEHSPLSEFYDPSRPKICLLDDNVLGCPTWEKLWDELLATNKPFKFKQGLDERILTDRKCEKIAMAKYDGDYTFAFDNIADYDLIKSKLQLIKKYARPKASIKFYVLVGFESTDIQDIENAFKRIELLMQFQCLPYIMRFQNKNEQPWKNSIFQSMYVTLARWCNQPSIFKKKSFRQFCEFDQSYRKDAESTCPSMQALQFVEHKYPEIAKKYFDLTYEDYRREER